MLRKVYSLFAVTKEVTARPEPNDIEQKLSEQNLHLCHYLYPVHKILDRLSLHLKF